MHIYAYTHKYAYIFVKWIDYFIDDLGKIQEEKGAHD